LSWSSCWYNLPWYCLCLVILFPYYLLIWLNLALSSLGNNLIFFVIEIFLLSLFPLMFQILEPNLLTYSKT
jgi:hypothetical protein